MPRPRTISCSAVDTSIDDVKYTAIGMSLGDRGRQESLAVEAAFEEDLPTRDRLPHGLRVFLKCVKETQGKDILGRRRYD